MNYLEFLQTVFEVSAFKLPGGPHFAEAHSEHVGRTGCAGQECPETQGFMSFFPIGSWLPRGLDYVVVLLALRFPSFIDISENHTNIDMPIHHLPHSFIQIHTQFAQIGT